MTRIHTVTFRKLKQDEEIYPSDFHSLDDGVHLSPILHVSTITQSPKDFSSDRSFWRAESMVKH